MKILLATDAWAPQVNGVVRTLTEVTRELRELDHDLTTIHPNLFPTVPCPFYPEIRLALCTARQVGGIIEKAAPDAIHIATEGPIGQAARRWCLRRRYQFSTAFHTRLPEYLAEHSPIPTSWTYAVLRRFHAAAGAVMVPTDSIRRDLASRGFAKLRPWGRGVDPDLFNPARRDESLGFARPIFLSVGRVEPEKNLPAFLSLDLPGTKLVVGDGSLTASLRRQFSDAQFIGRRQGTDLATIYASADVLVFPSRTDTFGLVMIEALASGLPVAAYPVAGPADVIGNSGAGILSEDLGAAAMAALAIPRDLCRAHARNFTWQASAEQFFGNLRPRLGLAESLVPRSVEAAGRKPDRQRKAQSQGA